MGELAFDDPAREWIPVKDALKRVRDGANCYYWYSSEGPKRDQTSHFNKDWTGIKGRGLMVSPVQASGLKPQRKRKPKHKVANDLQIKAEYRIETRDIVVCITSPSLGRHIMFTSNGPYEAGPNLFMAFEET